MNAVTLVDQLSLADLEAIGEGCVQKLVSDMDFLETLAAWRCLIVPPWVLRLKGDGTTRRLTLLTYDSAMNLDKPRILLDVAGKLHAKTSGVDARSRGREEPSQAPATEDSSATCKPMSGCARRGIGDSRSGEARR